MAPDFPYPSTKRDSDSNEAAQSQSAEAQPWEASHETDRLLVGQHKQSFEVPKPLITNRSRFIRAECSRQKDGTEPIELLDDDPEIFTIYVNCLLTGKMVVLNEAETVFIRRHRHLLFGSREEFERDSDGGSCCSTRVNYERENEEEIEADDKPEIWDKNSGEAFRIEMKTWRHLVKLYVLADRLVDLVAVNQVVDTFVKASDYHHSVGDLWLVDLVYASTKEDSRLRSLMVDWWLHEKDSFQGRPDATDVINPAFFGDLLDYIDTLRGFHSGDKVGEVLGVRARKRLCSYHTHDEEVPRCEWLICGPEEMTAHARGEHCAVMW